MSELPKEAKDEGLVRLSCGQMFCQLGSRLSCVTKRLQNIVHQGREKFTSVIQKPRSEHLGWRIALDLPNADLGTKILPSY